MTKTQPIAGEPAPLLFEQLQEMLLNGYEERHPFTVESFLGVIKCKFDLLVAHRELLACFLTAVLARDERVSGRGINSYTDEEARMLLASHDEERQQFMPLALALFDEQVIAKVEEALGQLFREVKWQALHRLGYSLEVGKLRQMLEDAALEETNRRLDVPGSGRYHGSVQSKVDKQRKAAEKEAKVVAAIEELYAPDKFWNVARSEIADKLGISMKMLKRWLDACNKSLDELVDIAEYRQRNNSN